MKSFIYMIGLPFYMLITMWWKYILVFPFLLARRKKLVHKLRFTILGLLICYTVDMVVPRLYSWISIWQFDLRAAPEWAQVWMLAITGIKISISSALLFFLCKFYEKARNPVKFMRAAPGQDDPIYRQNKDKLLVYGLISAAIGFALAAALTILSIKKSTSSTAAIGYLYVPMAGLFWSPPFFVFGFAIGYIKIWRSSQVRKLNVKIVLALAVSVVLLLTGVTFAGKGLWLTGLVHRIKYFDEAQLRNTLEASLFGKNKFVLGAIAQNKAASGELLDRIGRIDDKELYDKMGSVFDVMGENGHGLAVMRLVARHPNVLPETLEHLAECTNDYVLGDVAGNNKTSVDTLIRLRKRNTYLIDWGLARNPATPPEILSALATSGDEYTRAPVAANPSTPLRDIEKLSSDSNWNVRRSVVSNPQITIELLDKLSVDTDERVRSIIRFNKRTANISTTTNTTQQSSGDRVLMQQGNSALSENNTMSRKVDTDRDFLTRQLAGMKKLTFNEAIAKPAWWDTTQAPLLTSEVDVDRLWQKPDHNNREFFKACYGMIETHSADERATVKCLWLMPVAVGNENKKPIREYLIANYFDHKANTRTCANCAPGDPVARVADDLSTQYEWDGKIRSAIELLEKVLDQRGGDTSPWVQAEIYTHLGKLYLILEVTKERQQRIENAYERLTLIKDHESMKQRYLDFERVYLKVKAQR
jgi:hypothetical protein